MEAFAAKGLLSLCLRCLASPDPGIHCLASQALTLYQQWIATPEAMFR